MKNQDFFDISLPKWPAMVVTGKPVSREQALEVIIRTDSYWDYPSTNHREADQEILIALGIGVKPLSTLYGDDEEYATLIKEYYNKLDEFKEKINRLTGISYLSNSWAGTSYIGGPNGWISPDGTISQTDKNIGKYPDVKDVYEEWKTIAKEFPFLELNATLFNGESCEDGVGPLVTFKVKSGKVRMVKPSSDTTVYPTKMDMVGSLSKLLSGSFKVGHYTSEHRWSPAELKEIVDMVIERVSVSC